MRIYNPQEKKLDPGTICGYFIGYIERTKGCRFYFPSYTARIVESRNAKFLENDLISGSGQFQDIDSKKDHYEAQPFGLNDRLVVIHTPQVDHEATLRRSIREKKSSIPSDYVVYLLESNYNIGATNDLGSFSQTMSSKESNLWYNAMKDEMNFMASNQV